MFHHDHRSERAFPMQKRNTLIEETGRGESLARARWKGNGIHLGLTRGIPIHWDMERMMLVLLTMSATRFERPFSFVPTGEGVWDCDGGVPPYGVWRTLQGSEVMPLMSSFSVLSMQYTTAIDT